MNVDSISASSLVQSSNLRQQNHRVQNVFADVLEAVGRRGYASATDSQDDAQGDLPLSNKIQSAWSDWFQAERGGRYATADEPEKLKEGFGKVLARAHAEGGYVQPKQFLSGLTADELEVVKKIHSLANPIAVEPLTEEGALNLLLPPAAQVDLNHDGITQSGLANGLRFPDSNTPADVVAAWEETTAGMSLGDRMMYEFRMVSPIITANIHLDENGAYSHHYEPGDPEFVNPMAAGNYSYVDATQDQLNHLDFVKSWITQEQYDRQTDFWQRLQSALIENGAQ